MRSQDIEFENCCECSAHTGRAGRGEDSLYAGSRGPYCDECYGELPDKLAEECDDKDYQIERLEAKLAAAEADAERYRWLRDNGNIKWSLDFDDMVISFEADPRITEAGAAGLDAAIDAARGDK